MQPIRIFFRKGGPSRYMSHLDLTRTMTRVMRRADIPLWYTEGFNPHPFMTFALPLSLGTTGLYEILDIRLVEDMPLEEVAQRLNRCLPEGIEVFSVALPKQKHTTIAWSGYTITLRAESMEHSELARKLTEFVSLDSIMAQKRTKSKKMVEFDLKPDLRDCKVAADERGAVLSLLLPAGCERTVNPSVVIDAFSSIYEIDELESTIVRESVYTADMQIFE